MTTLKLIGFTGEVPRIQARMLPDAAAQLAVNVRLQDGTLTPVHLPKFTTLLDAPDGVVKTIYKHKGDWLFWYNDVNAAPGPVADDRLYTTGDGAPKMLVAGVEYDLAVPFPPNALVATRNITSISREYGYSNVDNANVESELSPTLSITFDSNFNIKLDGFVAPAGIAKQRIYRKQDGVWQRICERGATAITYTDIGEQSDAVSVPSASATAAPASGLSRTLIEKNLTTRFYVYTNVTEFDEESEPSPASNEVDWAEGTTVTLSGFDNAAPYRGFNRQRIYRLQNSASTGADLYFIAERPASTADFVDTVPVDGIGENLPSRDWTAPLPTMQGLIALPNGMMAAFDGKDLCFCEPYRPHAWPEKYRLRMDYKIVGLGAFLNTIIVMTEGFPYAVQGTLPENMLSEKLEKNLPCINKRGIVDMGYAVVYPSNDGLVSASASGTSVISESVMTRQDWQEFGPSTLVAGQYSGRYFASYDYLDSTGQAQNGTFILDLENQLQFMLRSSQKASAFFRDVESSALYMLQELTISEYDAVQSLPDIYSWRSKQFMTSYPDNFGVIFIEAEDSITKQQALATEQANEQIIADNAHYFYLDSMGSEIGGAPMATFTVAGDPLLSPVPSTFASVDVIADGYLIATITKLNEPVRLPSGFTSRRWEVQANGTAEINQITLARTMMELRESQ